MTFTVTLTTENAAFQDRPDEVEVARILTTVANRLLDGERDGKCIDSNGNTVGAFGFTVETGRTFPARRARK